MYWHVVDTLTGNIVETADNRRDAYALRAVYGSLYTVKKEQ